MIIEVAAGTILALYAIVVLPYLVRLILILFVVIFLGLLIWIGSRNLEIVLLLTVSIIFYILYRWWGNRFPEEKKLREEIKLLSFKLQFRKIRGYDTSAFESEMNDLRARLVDLKGLRKVNIKNFKSESEKRRALGYDK